jgi:electron transport complex protein RnfD
MGNVCIALLPALVASILLYGFYPLVVVLLSVASAVGGEALFNIMRKKQNTLQDLSAVVTGMILGLSLPPVLLCTYP